MKTVERTATGLRPTVALVDLAAIRHNLRILKPPGAEVMAVVKADGYGHGAIPVAGAALEASATWLGVASMEEGIALRDGGIDAQILVLSELASGGERDALRAGLTPTLYTNEGLARLASVADELQIRARVHVKVDTGMHRAGVDPEETDRFVAAVRGAGIEVQGLWTHFAKSDEPGDPFTALQLDRFNEVSGRVRAAGVRPRYLHAANSAATMTNPAAHLDLVRTGMGMYGIAPAPGLADGLDLRPALSWKSGVSMVKRLARGERISYGLRYRLDREAWVATVPVGYADGYRRGLSEHAEVLIRGRRYPVAGTITMDLLTVDCGDGPVAVGDEVALIGRQGEEEITAEDLAAKLETIAYEVLCGIGPRVRREYLGA
jgi:alanine racemase